MIFRYRNDVKELDDYLYIELSAFPRHLNAYIRAWAQDNCYSKELANIKEMGADDTRLIDPWTLYASAHELDSNEVRRLCSEVTEDIPEWALELTGFCILVVDKRCETCDNVKTNAVILRYKEKKKKRFLGG